MLALLLLDGIVHIILLRFELSKLLLGICELAARTVNRIVQLEWQRHNQPSKSSSDRSAAYIVQYLVLLLKLDSDSCGQLLLPPDDSSQACKPIVLL